MSITDGSNDLGRGEYNHSSVSSHDAPHRAAARRGIRAEQLALGFALSVGEMVGHYYEVVACCMILRKEYPGEHFHQCFHRLLTSVHLRPSPAPSKRPAAINRRTLVAGKFILLDQLKFRERLGVSPHQLVHPVAIAAQYPARPLLRPKPKLGPIPAGGFTQGLSKRNAHLRQYAGIFSGGHQKRPAIASRAQEPKHRPLRVR